MLLLRSNNNVVPDLHLKAINCIFNPILFMNMQSNAYFCMMFIQKKIWWIWTY